MDNWVCHIFIFSLGSGKSSLLRVMCGLWQPDCGESMIAKICIRGVETLKRGRGSTPKMAGKSAVWKASCM